MSERDLWQEVLRATVDDAILGPASVEKPIQKRRICKEAREYLTIASKDLYTVCFLAGLDSEAVIDRMSRRIAEAPSIDEIAGSRRKSRAVMVKRITERKGRKKAATYTFNGETLTAREWSQKTGILASTISGRIDSGWPVSDALTLSVGDGRRRSVRYSNVRNQPRRTRSDVRTYTHNGVALTLNQWGERLNINPQTLQSRLRAGWTMEETFGTSRE
ncbi:hypothetical protein [Pseudogemmobacter bohemicus]|uniref:hypothetical protein n=1 Tax=Pseudogemmobacter bohemicus TaxID=2250708 RepID=UPI0013008873|nr:hypothetical protein [Pseudogemmobacter bohemicus]